MESTDSSDLTIDSADLSRYGRCVGVDKTCIFSKLVLKVKKSMLSYPVNQLDIE